MRIPITLAILGSVLVFAGGINHAIGQGAKLASPSDMVSFRNQVLPVLTKHGCNSGGCHGRGSGQNGFKLSLFGFDPAADYAALVRL